MFSVKMMPDLQNAAAGRLLVSYGTLARFAGSDERLRAAIRAILHWHRFVLTALGRHEALPECTALTSSHAPLQHAAAGARRRRTPPKRRQDLLRPETRDAQQRQGPPRDAAPRRRLPASARTDRRDVAVPQTSEDRRRGFGTTRALKRAH